MVLQKPDIAPEPKASPPAPVAEEPAAERAPPPPPPQLATVESTKKEDVTESSKPEPSSASPECPTPTRRQPMKTDYVGVQSDGTKLAADLPAAVQVPEEAAPWTPVLGESTVRSLYSPDWKTREQALQTILRSLGNARWNAEHGHENIWNTVTQLLDRALK